MHQAVPPNALNAVAQALAAQGACVRANAPLARLTTFRVGGPADLLLVAQSAMELALARELCARHNVPFCLLGNGSNVLVRDEGVAGLVAVSGDGMKNIRLENGLLYADCGALLYHICAFAAQNGLAGLEFACGIPGSLGGALWMNAGAYGGETGALAHSVLALSPQGETRTLTADALSFGYRHSCFMQTDCLILGAWLALPADDSAAIQGRMDEFMRLRREKQPLQPSAGSFFKRPQGHFAGKLIQEAGLKGAQIGGAMVSPLHAGFIINAGGATAADILALMARVRQTVAEQTGVLLEPEVRILGRDCNEVSI